MRDQIIAVIAVALVVVMVAWQTSDRRDWRKENLRLRREIARLTRHPSTLRPGLSVIPGGKRPKWAEGIEESLPPYMKRYADDE